MTKPKTIKPQDIVVAPLPKPQDIVVAGGTGGQPIIYDYKLIKDMAEQGLDLVDIAALADIEIDTLKRSKKAIRFWRAGRAQDKQELIQINKALARKGVSSAIERDYKRLQLSTEQPNIEVNIDTNAHKVINTDALLDAIDGEYSEVES